MGFIIGCFLLGLLMKVGWDFASKPTKRSDMLEEYLSKPLQYLFMTLWMVFFVMFFVGVFVPAFGLVKLTDSGWQMWEVGIFGFFGMFLITCFVDIEKLDGK